MSVAERTYSLPINAIEIKDRFRQDPGDLTDLRNSIAEIGLLHPVVVTEGGRLLAGARRLEACRLLGWTEIPTRVVDSINTAAEMLAAERDENTCRKAMAPSEMVALGAELEKLEKPKAVQKMAEGGKKAAPGRPSESSDDSANLSRKFDTREVVAKAVGTGSTRYGEARTVVSAASDPNPLVAEVAAVAVRDMDETGNVRGAYDRVTAAKQSNGSPPPGAHAKWDKTTERYNQHAQKSVARLWKMLHGVDVAGPALAEYDAELVVGAVTAQEATQMLDMAGNAVRGIREFQRNLKGRIAP